MDFDDLQARETLALPRRWSAVVEPLLENQQPDDLIQVSPPPFCLFPAPSDQWNQLPLPLKSSST
jgi:hypothetical protein